MTVSNMTSFPFRDRRKPGADTCGCVHEILKYRAMLQDNRLRNRFLKELVNNYSQAQLRLTAMNRNLSEQRSRLDEDLRAAAGIQKSLLPQTLPPDFRHGNGVALYAFRDDRRGFVQCFFSG